MGSKDLARSTIFSGEPVEIGAAVRADLLDICASLTEREDSRKCIESFSQKDYSPQASARGQELVGLVNAIMSAELKALQSVVRIADSLRRLLRACGQSENDLKIVTDSKLFRSAQ